MKSVSNVWLLISPAFCKRLSCEYIAVNNREGRNICKGSTVKLIAAAASMISRLAARKRKMSFID